MLADGRLNNSALYWQQGIIEWRPLSEMSDLYSEDELRLLICPKQRAYLDFLGISNLPSTARLEASALIDKATVGLPTPWAPQMVKRE